jgi:hypothetical protein
MCSELPPKLPPFSVFVPMGNPLTSPVARRPRLGYREAIALTAALIEEA